MAADDGHGKNLTAIRKRKVKGARAVRQLTEYQRLVGWREWLALPALGISRIQAKVDTGARTSALHVYDLEAGVRDGHHVVRFRPPVLDLPGDRVVEVAVRDVREVKNSSGQTEKRCVISSAFVLGSTRFVAEITLTSRDDMVYNMLVGRSALRIGRLIVHPGRSYVQGPPKPRQ